MSTSIRNIVSVGVVLSANLVASCDGFSLHQHTVKGRRTIAPLHMTGFPQIEEDIPSVKRGNANHKRSAELSAVAAIAAEDRAFPLQAEDDDSYLDFGSPVHNTNDADEQNLLKDWILPVLSTSFLITANTVGATCLVIPDLAAGPGFAPTCALSVVTYFINLISGLVMAEVAIKQYESSGSEVATSFKDFADASFKSPLISNVIALVSILTNAGVLAFTFSKAGALGSELLGGGGLAIDPTTVSFGYVGLVGMLMSSLSSEKLSAVASMCVAGLFVAFAGLLLPGLLAVQDPMATMLAPGIGDNCLGAVAQAFPILLLSLVYQNIVPSVTKILNYDRQKTTASLALGSFIPLAMYLSWCFASMGGGIDASGPLLTGFSVATIAGSSVGTTMSIAEEFDSFLKAPTNDDDDSVVEKEKAAEDDVFSVPAVAASVAIPMVTTTLFGGDDMICFLGLAGSIGTPLLYGVVPALMAWNQRREEQSTRQQNLVPGGMASLGALGLASTGFVGQELVNVMMTTFTT